MSPSKRLAPGHALLLAFLASCASDGHISSYVPKHREYELPVGDAGAGAAATPGSLFDASRPAVALFTDARALRQNDLVVIRVEEIADAKRSADTDLTRSSESQAAITEFLGQLQKLRDAGFDPKFGGNSSSAFTGNGTTARTERLTATVPALVRKVLPNGNLFVEGHRVVLVNNEEQHFYISGVIRPIDIEGDNSVKSSMVADAEIEFTGRGVLSDNQKQGVVSRYLGWLWPF